MVGRYLPSTGAFDTLAVSPGAERNSDDHYRAYGRDLALAPGDNVVYVGDTGSDTILALGLNGDTIAAIEVPFPPSEVPADAKTVRFRPSRRLADGTAQGDPYLYPDRYPRFGRLFAAPGDRLWVMAYPPLKEPVPSTSLLHPNGFFVEEGGARWKVLDRNGVPIAEVRTPPGLFLLEVGDDYILALSRDALEIESVRLHRLKR